MNKFRIQLILDSFKRNTRYNLPENDRYSTSTTDWHLLVNLNLTVEKYGMKLNYHRIVTTLADKCFSNITTTLSL